MRLNNKGFAVSIILYSIAAVVLLVLLLIVSVDAANVRNSANLAENVKEKLSVMPSYLVKSGAETTFNATDNIGGAISLYAESNASYTTEKSAVNNGDHITFHLLNNTLFGSTTLYSSASSLDLTAYKKMYITYRVTSQIFGSTSYHAHAFIGFQKTRATDHTKIEGAISKLSQITPLDTGKITEEVDISGLNANYYLVFFLMACKGEVTLEVTDVWLE